MNRFFLVLFLLISSAAHATSTPVVYSLDQLTIEPGAQNETATTGVMPPPASINIQVRDAESFYKQEGWVTVQPFKPQQGLLLLFDEPSQTPITHAPHYAAMDVLMIDSTGSITTLVPSLVLAEMDGPIYPREPVKAFLLMAGGSSEELLIQPGDVVTYSAFKKPHPVLDSAPDSARPAPPVQQRLKTPEQQVMPPAKAPASGGNNDFDINDLFEPEQPPAPVRRKPSAQPSIP